MALERCGGGKAVYIGAELWTKISETERTGRYANLKEVQLQRYYMLQDGKSEFLCATTLNVVQLMILQCRLYPKIKFCKVKGVS